MKRAVVVAPLAARDLGEIWDFIARDSIDTADRVADEIEAEFRKLADMPRQGHERPDVDKPRLRFWGIYSYVIAYEFDEFELRIVRIVSGYRDFRTLFKPA